MLPRRIRYFIAVAEDEHFGRASRRLRIAQPALSRQIRTLEDELGFDLFERLPRGVRLTHPGRVLLAEMREVEAQLLRGIAAARSAAEGRHGRLRLSLIDSAAWHGVVPNALRAYRARFPDVEVSLSTMPAAQQIAWLSEGRTDAAIVYNIAEADGLVSTHLASIPIVLAMPADCPLLALPRIRVRDLSDYPLIGFQRAASPKLFDDLTAALADIDFTRNFISEPTNEADMLALVSMGSGLALANAMQSWRPPHGVAFAPVEDLNVTQSLNVLHRRDDNSPLRASFIDALLAEASTDGTGDTRPEMGRASGWAPGGRPTPQGSD